MKYRRYAKKDGVEINLTPLIDVVFLLLIFFMVSTTFDKEMQIGIQLPESSSEQLQQSEQAVMIAIDAQGRIQVNDLAPAMNLAELQSQLATLNQTGARFVINADAQSPHQSYIRVLDALRALGISRVSHSTLPLAQ